MSTPPPTDSEDPKPSPRRSLQEHQMLSARKFLDDSSDDDDFEDEDSDDEFASDRTDPTSRITIPTSAPPAFKNVDRYPARKTNLSGAMKFDKSCCIGNRKVCNTMFYQGSMKYKLNKIFLALVVAITLIVLLSGVGKMLDHHMSKHHKPKKVVVDQSSGNRLNAFGYKFIEMGLTRSLDFEDVSSPQSLALEWIAETDGARLNADDPLAYERYALAVLYYTTAGTDDALTPVETGHWLEATHWMSGSGICQWYGVVCEGDDPTETDDSKKDHHGSVQYLELPGNGLYGWMPRELSALTNMYKLDLSSNKFWGTIPDSLGTLSNLREMSFRSNALDGNIPASLAMKLTNMRQLDLGDNRLTGRIPYELHDHMLELRLLALDKNQLHKLPKIGNLAKLNHLFLEENLLTGAFPLSVTELTNLKTLSLCQNEITGTLPEELGKMTSLEKLRLGKMKLTGSIPPAMFGEGNHLMELHLNDNKLTGELPTTVGHLTKLHSMIVGENRLFGLIPSEIGLMTNLVTLNLHANELDGKIPDEIGKLYSLEHVYLHRNYLEGPITPEIGRLNRLTNLFLETNELTGSLPSNIGNIKTLREARFYENNFKGSMPEEICELGTDEELVYLGADCSSNFECKCCTKCF